MTREAKTKLSVGAIIGGSVILTAVLTLTGFESKRSHDADIQAVRTEQKEADARQEAAHQREYIRVICELEAIRTSDNRVCR